MSAHGSGDGKTVVNIASHGSGGIKMVVNIASHGSAEGNASKNMNL